ncbi:hypothetical protein D3C72_2353940 [compost metagenome]
MVAVMADKDVTFSLSAVMELPAMRAAFKTPAVIFSALRFAILASVIAAFWMLAVLT